MLNRRNLRIKAMQTLFGFQQVRASNLHIALQDIKEGVNGTELTEKHTEGELNQILLGSIAGDDTNLNIPSALKNLVAEVVSKYQAQTSKDLKFLRSQMVKEVEGIHQLFIWMMGLMVALTDLESARIAKRNPSSDKSPARYFENMQSIELIRGSLASMDVPSWQPYHDRLVQWYKEIKTHQEFAAEYDNEPTDLDTESRKLRYLFKSVLWKSVSFQNFFEEYDRGWVENKDIIKSMVNKTLKTIADEAVVFAPLSYQWEDDRQFFEELFDSTIKNESWSEKLIAESAKNWETDRIAQVDKTLLKMALNEMINFPSIPVKVTINEYIELSKKYSTPKSKKFINGILDVLANDLSAKGTIKKSGRGLIDNK